MKFLKFLNEVKIPVKNAGILEVPEGKCFCDLPISHYEKLVKEKGYKAIIRALTNLEVWNRKKDPKKSAKAKEIIKALQKRFKKD